MLLSQRKVLILLLSEVCFGLKTPVAQWHAKRRAAISRGLGSERVAELAKPTPLRTVAALVAVDAAHIYLATGAGGMIHSAWLTALVACTLGAWLSCGQFTLCHDVLHGGADLPVKSARTRRKLREGMLFVLSSPCVFGYWLYLELGHLSHHKFTGETSIERIFSSDQVKFEDGDLFFAGHRQVVEMRTEDEGPPVSIARLFFNNLWRPNNGLINAFAYSTSMLLERTAVCLNEKWVALSGSNRFFFKNKPQEFHDKCAGYARYASLVQLILFLVHGPTALLYLLLAEVSWQLPFFPASALFVSNHGLENVEEKDPDAPSRRPLPPATPAASCEAWPTHSVYANENGPLFDLVCWNANYHVEHHDFPEVSLWNLPQLRREANHLVTASHGSASSNTPLYFYPPTRPPGAVIWSAFQRPSIYASWKVDDTNVPKVIKVIATEENEPGTTSSGDRKIQQKPSFATSSATS